MKKKVIIGVALIIVTVSIVLTNINDDDKTSDNDSAVSQTTQSADISKDDDSKNESEQEYDSDIDIPQDTFGDLGSNVESDIIEGIDIPADAEDGNTLNGDFSKDGDNNNGDDTENTKDKNDDKDNKDDNNSDKNSNNNDSNNNNNSTDVDVNDSTPTKKPANEKVPESVKKTDYKVSSMTMSKGDNISIEYPVISDWDNTDMQEKWNNIFKERAMVTYNLLNENDNYYVNMSLKTKNDKLLSIVLEGANYIDNTEYGLNICYTYNIDMTTGENASLAKMYDVNEIAQKFVDEKCVINPDKEKSTCTHGDIAQFFSSSDSSLKKNLVSKLKNYDGIQMDGKSDPHTGYSYVQDNSLYLVMEVPHECGDYAIVKINN